MPSIKSCLAKVTSLFAKTQDVWHLSHIYNTNHCVRHSLPTFYMEVGVNAPLSTIKQSQQYIQFAVTGAAGSEIRPCLCFLKFGIFDKPYFVRVILYTYTYRKTNCKNKLFWLHQSKKKNHKILEGLSQVNKQTKEEMARHAAVFAAYTERVEKQLMHGVRDKRWSMAAPHLFTMMNS